MSRLDREICQWAHNLQAARSYASAGEVAEAAKRLEALYRARRMLNRSDDATIRQADPSCNH